MAYRHSSGKRTRPAKPYEQAKGSERTAEAKGLRTANDDLRKALSVGGWWTGDPESAQESKAKSILGRMDSDVDGLERGAKDIVEVLERRLELREELRQLWRSSNGWTGVSSRESSTSGRDY